MTITPVARILHLAEPAPPEGYFMGVEIPEETNTSMEERIVLEDMLTEGHLLKDLKLKSDELVILVRRNDRYIIPKGGLHLHPKDILLIVSERQELMAPEVTEHTNDRLLDRLKKLFR
jgi:potassium/proton antiporter